MFNKNIQNLDRLINVHIQHKADPYLLGLHNHGCPFDGRTGGCLGGAQK